MSDQLRSIFARWLALELSKAEISDGMKDLFAEAKGNGYDTKALRLAFRAKIKSDEPETDADRATAALVDTYLAYLDEPARAPSYREMRGILKPPAQPAPVRVEKIEEFRHAAPVKAAAEETEVQRGQANKPTAPAPKGDEPRASAMPAAEPAVGGAAKTLATAGASAAPVPFDAGPDMPSYLRRVG